MDAIAYCNILAEKVSAEEWLMLEAGDASLVISDHNRTTLMEMRDMAMRKESSAAMDGRPRSVNLAQAQALEKELHSYLNEHMADVPQGHKWIVLASLYLTYVAKRPMHPIDRVGIKVERQGSIKLYLCPYKIPGDNPICDSCVCKPMP